MPLRDVDDATVLVRVKRSPASRAGFAALDPPSARRLRVRAGDGADGCLRRGLRTPDVHCRSMLLFPSTPSTIRNVSGQRGRSVTPSCTRSVTHVLSWPVEV